MKIPKYISYCAVILFSILTLCFGKTSIYAQDSSGIFYVPLIGLTMVPSPLALPNGAGRITYRYSVKNFLREVALSDVHVVDDHCGAIIYVTGDDNADSKLDYSETWRYTCTTRLSQTTQSTSIATGTANNISVSHKAYATVIVGSNTPAPLVSIVNITKVAYPLSLPVEGGKIIFTYKVNNPGVVPLRKVTVIDDKCAAISGKLGDTNGNNLLDVEEVWIYTCTAILTRTTTNTVTVSAYANGLKAIDDSTITVKVDNGTGNSSPEFPDTGVNTDIKLTVWKILTGILMVLAIVLVVSRKIEWKEFMRH